MINLLTGLLATKYGKYVLEVVIVFGLVFGAYKLAEHHGRDVQKEQDSQQQASANEKARQAASNAKDIEVKAANDRANAAEADASAARAQFMVAAKLLQDLSAKEKAGRDHVAGLQDSELHGDVVSKLGLRAPGDATAGYLPKEERAIDEAVTQYPLCQQDRSALSSQVTQKQNEVNADEKVIAANKEAADANAKYLAVVLNDYKALWDAHPPRYHSAACLWLWRCGKKKVEFKAP